MKPLKVMIVDDEILAVKDLVGLISWEERGFLIAATATNSAKALELYQLHYPHIIFIDIRMPIMDGLQLSQQIFALGQPVKIVLLTAYRDFDYAKKALEIGVSNYLLKHDINETTIIKELDKLRRELTEEAERDRILRQRYFRNLLEGKETDTAGWVQKKALPCGEKEYTLSLIVPNHPFLEQFRVSDSSPIEPADFDNINFPEFVAEYDILSINGHFVLIFTVKRTNSLSETRERMLALAALIQSSIQSQSRETCSIILTKTCPDPVGLASLYQKALTILPYLVFFHRGKVIYSEDFPVIVQKNSPNPADDIFTELSDSLAHLDLDRICRLIGDLFHQAADPVLNPEELRKSVNHLLYLLELFQKQNHLPAVSEKYPGGVPNPLSGYTCDELYNGFLKEFSAAVEQVNMQNSKVFSKKTKLALQYIHQHYAEDLTVDKVAEELGFSGVYLSQIFKKETGRTFLEYLTDYRIETAKNLLQNGDYKVYEVAEIVGYKTSQYFSQVFRKVTGVYPIDYRERGTKP